MSKFSRFVIGGLAAALTVLVVAAVPRSNAAGDPKIENPDAVVTVRSASAVTPAGSTYTWQGGTPVVTTDWTVATNWNPSRLTPATTDNLIIDGSSTPSPTITNIPTQTIGTLTLSNGATATFNAASGSQTLIISGATGIDLAIPSSCSLTLAGSNALAVSVSSGSKAIIGGQLVLQEAAHRLMGADANGITFQNGSIFTTATGFSGNPFGSGTDASVLFQSGSSAFFNAGSDPFGGSGHSVATFTLGSSQSFNAASAFSSDGRTYGNLTLDGSQTYAGAGGGLLTTFNTMAIVSGSTLTLSASPGGDLNLLGDIAVNGSLNTNGRTVKFQGGNVTQNITTAATFGDVSIAKIGGTVKLGGTLTINGALQFDGTSSANDVLELNQQTLNLNGTIGGTSGSAANGFKGDSAGATLNIGGTGALGILKFVSGSQSLKSLSVNRASSGTVTLGGNLTIGTASAGSLTLTNGVVDVESNTLSLASAATITRTNGYVIGNLQKTFGSTGNFTFTVGTANGYSPVDANVSSGTGNSLTVKAIQGRHPNMPLQNALLRYWTISNSGSVTANLTFNYSATDVVGAEANYRIWKYNGSFISFTPNTVNTISHFATLNGVASFSDWTLADPSLTVNTTADPGDGMCTTSDIGDGCTLREAITAANLFSDPNTINFDIAGAGPHTIQLTTALPNLSVNIDINNTSGKSITVQRSPTAGTPSFRIFTIDSGVTASISNLTITNGAGFAAGVYNKGTLTSTNCTVSGNAAGAGVAGGIANEGTLTLSNSVVSGNSAGGSAGGIDNLGTIHLTNSTITGNTAATAGGGVYNRGGARLDLANSIISGNSANCDGGCGGGGIYNESGGLLTVTNSTLSGNSTNGDGGGIYNLDAGGQVTLTSVTITNNRSDADNNASGAGGGIRHIGSLTGNPLLRNCIIAGNYRGPGTATADDIANGFLDSASSFNLVGAGGSGGLTNGVNNNQVGVANPGLGPLGNNGGPTQTHHLKVGSPAVDQGKNFATDSNNTPILTDQRGFTRPFNDSSVTNGTNSDGTDIGAYELQGTDTQGGPSLVVNTLDDHDDGACTAGDCTLREAINAANSIGSNDAIAFNVSGTITLSSTLPAIVSGQGTLTIDGSGGSLTISGNNSVRVMLVNSGANLTLLTLKITNGQGVNGGGINNQGTLTIANSTFSGNNASNEGGGIENTGTLTVANSTFSNNSAINSNGGGIDSSGPVTLTNSTFFGNSALNGGGINSFNNTLIVTNSTFSGNGAGNGAAILNNAGTATLRNTVIANSTAGGNCSGTISDGGNNLQFGGTVVNSCGASIATADPKLAAPANNGGPTQTHLLLPGSAAINAGTNVTMLNGAIDNSTTTVVVNDATSIPAGVGFLIQIDAEQMRVDAKATNTLTVLRGANSTSAASHIDGAAVNPAFDQRGPGFARRIGTAADIGAVEVNFAISATAGSGQSAPINSTFPTQFKATVTESGNPVSGVAVTFTPPVGGASGTFASSSTVNTDANGIATAPAFTANGTAGGPYNVIASVIGNLASAAFTLTNLKGDQTITVNIHAPTSRTYNSSFTVSATASSGLPVAYSSSGACTNTGATFTMTSGTGSCTVKYDQAGDSNYTQASQVTESVTAVKATQTITFGTLPDKTFGDADFSVSASASSNLTVGFTASGQCSINGSTVHLLSSGSCTVTAKQPGDANYNAAPDVPQTFTINKAGSTTAVSSSVNPSDFGQNVTFTATVSSSAGTPTGTVQFKDGGNPIGCSNPSGQTLSSGLATCQTTILSAGTHTITADYSGDGNFSGSAGTLSGGQVVRSQPSLSIDDVSASESDSGTRNFTFTVSLSAVSNLQVKVDYATADNTATVTDSDYQSQSGTLTFDPGDTNKTITIPVNGDQKFEANETFLVNLSNPMNAAINDNQGLGTIVNDDAQGGIISFSQSNYNVNESDGFVTVTVNRTGDISRAATVDYMTDDTGAPTSCSIFNGFASSRCDFTTAIGKLKFGANEGQKSLVILVNGDGYNGEIPSESLSLKLSNLTGGAVFGVPSTASVTILNSGSPTPNAIDDARNFVRQHYHDFLNREPDQSGWDFWTNQITSCGSDLPCNEVHRINVSASFFLSIEFQQTGYLVERMYKVAYADAAGTSTLNGSHPLPVPVIRLNEFLAGTQRIGQSVIVLAPGWEQLLESNKQAYAQDFVQTSRFTTALPTTMTPDQFVDKLNQNAGNVLSASERTTAINLFGGAPNSSNAAARAQALRQVAEDQDLVNAEFNRAFVLMQYFGYLRRNPNDAPEAGQDYTGYDFWLTKLNQFNGNYVDAEMVKAFLSSIEYRQRF